MRRFDAYIRRNVLQAMLLVLLVLAGLDFLFTLFDEMAGTDERYRAVDALSYVMLTFPRHLYDLLPMTALMGSLIGLAILASSNELVVMRAAGVKVVRIVWAVMKPAMLVMLCGLLLGEFVAPPLELKAEVDKTVANSDEDVLSSFGDWQRDDNDFLHFNAIEPDGVLHGVRIYQFNAARELSGSIIAETASYENGGWRLENVQRTVFSNGGESIQSELQQLDELDWEIGLTPELLQLMIMDSGQLAISDLYSYAQRVQAQGQDARPYLLAFWGKVLQPLTTASLVLVAISFIFGPLRQATMGSRVFTGICFGLLFIILQRLFNTISLVYQFNPLLSVLAPILFSALLGLLLLRRAA